MKIKEAVYKTCGECGKGERVGDEAFGCDTCKKAINLHGLSAKNHHQYLEASIFKHGGQTKHFQFCSWKCCLAKVRMVRSNYFVTLPYLLYDETQKGIRAKDFFAAIKAPR